MIGKALILLAILIGIGWFLYWFTRTPPERVARVLRKTLLWGVIGVVILAALTGRLNPLFALLAASIPILLRLGYLLSLLPAIQQLLRALGVSVPTGGYSSAPGGTSGDARTSSIRTRFLAMQLEHETGQMDGEVLKGRYRGQRLADLGLDQLLELLDECRAADAQSAALLETYLDREYGDDWEEQARGRSGRTADGGRLSKQEAFDILGLEPGASPDQIRAAHRRLMQRYHPDRGGTDYLAAKINEAKRLLLGD
ncbi:DnaJ domain-containing protein [Thioalkalicoccus limnaeus]|uniref:DnaJ domain-containing protein n=1 Tax=Thioalkalicoccus limnaeus TaxID=120681 RepID=A0ABV4BE35_9GAMM